MIKLLKISYLFTGLLVCLSILPCTGSEKIVEAARSQVEVTVRYAPAYRALKYPGGDFPNESGVCTDVVIRALCKSKDMDLQKLVHEDMRDHFMIYPKMWSLKKPDKNIDYRRVPILQTYFKRQGWSLPVTQNPKDYLPGDLVTCIVPPRLPHIMIVSDRKNEQSIPWAFIIST